MGKYKVIYVDPPWEYNNLVSNGAAQNHYGGMKLAEMCALNVYGVSDKDSVLIMWYTGNFTEEAQFLAKAWGFKVKTMKGLTWAKLNEKFWRRVSKAIKKDDLSESEFIDLLNKESRMNGGNYTRANSEDALIAVRGKGVERIKKNVKQLIIAPLANHSGKPQEARKRIEILYGDVPRIELFARGHVEGWDTWGNECHCSVELQHGVFLENHQHTEDISQIQIPEF